MTLTLDLTPDLELRLSSAAQAQGTTPESYALAAIEKDLSDEVRRKSAVALLRSWRDPALAAEQKETGEYLIRALDEDRTSDRKLFPPELKGITW